MLKAGERIDEWVVDAPLGAGGTASVYACHNASAPRIRAALKVLDAGALERPDARARLLREGEVLAGLEHPAIVRVFSARPEAAPPYLVMALVEGESLSARIHTRGALPLDQALPLMEALAQAVAYLHERGVQHRDLKPANMLLRDEDDAPVLVDFGLVLAAGATRLTADGLRMGTVSYVPPEWAEPQRIDPVKWDLYSLGATFWEILVGRRAFPLPDDMEPTAGALRVMVEKRGHPPLDPGPDAPFFLRLLIRDMTNPDPLERPDSAADVLTRLQAGDAGAGIDPVELFRTPMPTWSSWESDPASDPMATSSVPLSPAQIEGRTPDRMRSFATGAVAGGVAVALAFAAAAGWWLGARSVAPAPAPPKVVVEPARDPAPSLGGAPERAAPVRPPAPAPTDLPAVEARAFATWIETHPDWARDAAIAAGTADAGYLDGWAAEIPPGPATRVSWNAAVAYCADRGGLAAVDAPPLRWEVDARSPYMEWRQRDGRPAWRAGDGRASERVDPAQTTFATGLRCAW